MNKLLISLACLPLASAWALDTQPLSGAEQLPIARMTENGKAYLVDAKGFSLYRFDKDAQGKSTCYAECAEKWPPALASAEQAKAADSGVKAMISVGRPFLDHVISALADAGFRLP